MKKIWNAGIIGLLLTSLFACEKVDSNVVMPERPQVGADANDPDANYDYVRYSSEGRLRDSVYFYTYYFYLWQDQLPTSYATHQHRTADALLNALKNYTKNGSGEVLDRYSFLDREGTINRELQEGILGSFGFDIRYLNETELYVKKVDIGSPAYQAGIRRGWKITEINGRIDLSLASMEQDNYQFLFSAITAPQIALKLRPPSGNEVSISLYAATFNYKPIMKSAVLEAGSKKVGYFALDAFVSNQLIRAELDGIMNSFHSAGVTELIMDLRYNGGGDVATANYITNLLAPISVNNTLMNSYVINNTLRMEGWDLFLFYPTYFSKTNALELDRVYFLVTSGTASASELLINNLTPHMDVKIIGDNLTYGKPVGYFGWDIMGVDLYAVSFQTLNSLGQGNYFDGLPPHKIVRDGLTYDFGDPREWMTAEALYYATHGSFSTGTGIQQSLGRSARQFHHNGRDINEGIDSRSRKDMFDFRKQELGTLPGNNTTTEPLN